MVGVHECVVGGCFLVFPSPLTPTQCSPMEPNYLQMYKATNCPRGIASKSTHADLLSRFSRPYLFHVPMLTANAQNTMLAEDADVDAYVNFPKLVQYPRQ